MDIQTQIENTEKELSRLKREMLNCKHDFNEPFEDSYEKRVAIQENRPMGSDFFNPVTIGFKTELIPCWSRKCRKCGHKESTTKTQPIKYKPVF